MPILDAFVSSGSNQNPGYMTWEQDSKVRTINALDYYWDPVTRLFSLVPFIPLVVEGVLE